MKPQDGMLMAKILKFPEKKILKRLPLPVKEIKKISFRTEDGRKIYINDKSHIAALMAFIKREGITLFEITKL